jgi:hypothetical protein
MKYTGKYILEYVKTSEQSLVSCIGEDCTNRLDKIGYIFQDFNTGVAMLYVQGVSFEYNAGIDNMELIKISDNANGESLDIFPCASSADKSIITLLATIKQYSVTWELLMPYLAALQNNLYNTAIATGATNVAIQDAYSASLHALKTKAQ